MPCNVIGHQRLSLRGRTCRRARAPVPAAIDREGLADLIGQSLYRAATLRRTRFQAVFELALEATRSPALGDALSGLAAAAVETTIAPSASTPIPTRCRH